MSADGKLVSSIVTCYNNGEVLFETLESIFQQTYPNIEVIIADDHSADFDQESIEMWIERNRTPQVRNVIIHRNEVNVGTVRNLEGARALAKGDYLTQIAGDDIYTDETVFEKFIGRLEELGEEAEFITGQCELYDVSLKKKLGEFVTADTISMMENYSPEQLFDQISVNCIIPAVYFARRSLSEKVGVLSDKYRLIEDWTGSLRMARMGVRFHYLDVSIMKHRDGGVSHGNRSRDGAVYRAYVHDYLNAYRFDVLPYSNMISEAHLAKIIDNYRYWSTEYQRLSAPPVKTVPVKNESETESDSNPDSMVSEEIVVEKRYNIIKRTTMGIIDSCINLLMKIRFSVQDKWFR